MGTGWAMQFQVGLEHSGAATQSSKQQHYEVATAAASTRRGKGSSHRRYEQPDVQIQYAGVHHDGYHYCYYNAGDIPREGHIIGVSTAVRGRWWSHCNADAKHD